MVYHNINVGHSGVQEDQNFKGVILLTGRSEQVIKLILYGEAAEEVEQEVEIDGRKTKVKVNNVTNTAFTFQNDTEIRFSSAPANGDKILIYLDEWYELQPVTSANTYLADDVALNESTVFTLPIHQRSKNFTLRVFNDSPFPVSLNSMMWEGNYSPRFYRRT